LSKFTDRHSALLIARAYELRCRAMSADRKCGGATARKTREPSARYR
jgi:hypothetical protein